jgi:hypothetical protein
MVAGSKNVKFCSLPHGLRMMKCRIICVSVWVCKILETSGKETYEKNNLVDSDSDVGY